MELNKLINSHKIKFDKSFKKLLNSSLSNDLLSKAMIYGSMNGGKRIRPFLVNFFGNLTKIEKKNSLFLSAAIECIHSYSLIHDDLPSMDNDDFRRGKLSTHKKFNEATAILAGDALHDFAFELLAHKNTSYESNLKIILINNLSKATGVKGLAGGQSLDLLFENKKIKISKIIQMYEMKTAALFSFACSAPYILAKKNLNEIKFAQNFGKLFGLIFQIADDILDEKKDFKLIGKTPGKDKKQGKSTMLSLISKEKIKAFCIKEIKNFEKENFKYLEKYPELKRLLNFNLEKLD